MPDSNESIPKIRQRVIDGMTKYMQPKGKNPGWDCGYSQFHIDRCAKIIDACLATLAPDSKLTEKEIREVVKRTVLRLNVLNSECNGSLIETDQREGQCHLLGLAAAQAGLETDEDITEDWREW